jgi:hypothetical protein
MKRKCPIPLDERDNNFKERCLTRAMLQEKEVAYFTAYGSFMHHFSFSSTIIYDSSNESMGLNYII